MSITVAQLVAKLQTAPQDAIIVTDMPFLLSSIYGYTTNSLNAPIVVAQGVASLLWGQNGTNVYISGDEWENYPQGVQGTLTAAIYIGAGNGIIGPEWQAL